MDKEFKATVTSFEGSYSTQYQLTRLRGPQGEWTITLRDGKDFFVGAFLSETEVNMLRERAVLPIIPAS